MDNANEHTVSPEASSHKWSGNHALEKSRFRWVLVSSIAIGLVGILVSLITERFLPDALIAYQDSQALEQEFSMYQGMPLFEIMTAIFGTLFLFVAIENLIQLYRFKNRSRRMAIGITIVAMLMTLLYGPVVESSLANLFGTTSALLWGAAMAMMFSEPYNTIFNNDNSI